MESELGMEEIVGFHLHTRALVDHDGLDFQGIATGEKRSRYLLYTGLLQYKGRISRRSLTEIQKGLPLSWRYINKDIYENII